MWSKGCFSLIVVVLFFVIDCICHLYTLGLFLTDHNSAAFAEFWHFLFALGDLVVSPAPSLVS